MQQGYLITWWKSHAFRGLESRAEVAFLSVWLCIKCLLLERSIKVADVNILTLTYTWTLHGDGEVCNSDSMSGLVVDSDSKLITMFIAAVILFHLWTFHIVSYLWRQLSSLSQLTVCFLMHNLPNWCVLMSILSLLLSSLIMPAG